MKFPYLTDAAIVGKVEELLAATFGRLEDAPTPIDLDAIIFDHLYEDDGMVFSNEADLGETEDGEEVLGVTYPRLGRVQVTSRLLAGAHLQGRYRFTVAHELGHWVLHRPLYVGRSESLDLFGDVVAEDPPLVGLARNIGPRAGGVLREEWQANRFAAVLLVNPTRLRFEFQERFGDQPLAIPNAASGPADTRDLARRTANVSVTGRPSLAAAFDVSVEAMAVALEARGYVTGTALLL